jgi:hypothetical protein
VRPAGGEALAPQQRQQHGEAEQVAQELRLVRVELAGEQAQQHVERGEDEAGGGHPGHGAQGLRGGGTHLAERLARRRVWRSGRAPGGGISEA